MLAICVIWSIGMIEVRIQLGQVSALQVDKNMLARSFYKGVINEAAEANDGKSLPLHQKAFIRLTAAVIGACVRSPADLALVRMQADATLPPAQRRNYTNAFHVLYHIIADEGV